jgi:hypothetical protein
MSRAEAVKRWLPVWPNANFPPKAIASVHAN